MILRINLHLEATPKPPQQLIQLWTRMLAEEYCVDMRHAGSWMHTPDCRGFVAEFLQSQGWRVQAYTTPMVSMERVVSHGFVVADDCEKFVAWKLSQP